MRTGFWSASLLCFMLNWFIAKISCILSSFCKFNIMKAKKYIFFHKTETSWKKWHKKTCLYHFLWKMYTINKCIICINKFNSLPTLMIASKIDWSRIQECCWLCVFIRPSTVFSRTVCYLWYWLCFYHLVGTISTFKTKETEKQFMTFDSEAQIERVNSNLLLNINFASIKIYFFFGSSVAVSVSDDFL